MKNILKMLQEYYADNEVTISLFKDQFTFACLINSKCEILHAWTINDIRKVMRQLENCNKKVKKQDKNSQRRITYDKDTKNKLLRGLPLP